MATIPAPGAHPKPRVTVSAEALPGGRIALILGITLLLALAIYCLVGVDEGMTSVFGKTITPGQIVYPGFDPEVLWKFRWYSLLNQLLIWTAIALVFGYLLDRFLPPAMPAPRAEDQDPEPGSRVVTAGPGIN